MSLSHFTKEKALPVINDNQLEIEFILPSLMKSEKYFLEAINPFDVKFESTGMNSGSIHVDINIDDTTLLYRLQTWFEFVHNSGTTTNYKADTIGKIIIKEYDKSGLVLRVISCENVQIVEIANYGFSNTAKFIADYYLEEDIYSKPWVVAPAGKPIGKSGSQGSCGVQGHILAVGHQGPGWVKPMGPTGYCGGPGLIGFSNIDFGYHKDYIKKGVLGEISKIEEELNELKDAEKQNSKIMMMVELSDMYGAIEEYCIKQGITMDDLKSFSDITKRAFKNGHRK